MEGTIISIENQGSIVIVWLEVEGVEHPVYFDARPFGWLLEGEGVRCHDDLIGRPVFFDGEGIEFLDTLEAA